MLKRNPDWRGERPAFDTIEVYPIDDEKTAEIAYEAGEIDRRRSAYEAGEIDYTRVSIDSGAAVS